MKGAIAELCARTIRTPRRKSVTSIGTSHHFLALQKNASNSPAVLKLPTALRAAFTAPIVILLTEWGTAAASVNRGSSLFSSYLAGRDISAERLSSATRRRLRLQPFRIYARLRKFHDVLELAVNPQFDG